MAGASRRQALTRGLILGVVVGLVGWAIGRAVPAEVPGPDRPAALGTKIGTVNAAQIFRDANRFKRLGEELERQFAARRQELAKISAKLRAELERKDSLRPGSRAYVESDFRAAQLMKELRKARGSMERDLGQRQAEMTAAAEKTIRDAIEAVAERRGLGVVLRIDAPWPAADEGANRPAEGPAIVYANPALEITREVIATLNGGG